MYIVTIPKHSDFTRGDGRPFRQVKLDKEGMPVKKRDDRGNIAMSDGENPQPLAETEVAGYLDLLKAFLNNVFDIAIAKKKEKSDTPAMTIEHSGYAIDIFRAINVAKDSTLELEKAPYEWLCKIIKDYAVDVFGINAAIIEEPLKKAIEGDTTRAERRREEKGKGYQ